MKRGTPDHPKTLMLANELSIKKYAAVGLLEMLWHFTARYAPRGDIGRFADGIIGNSLDWGGSIPELIEALVKVGWVDKNNEYRLVVHDWSDHSDDAADKYLANHEMLYFDGKEPRRKPDKGVKVRRVAEKSEKLRRKPEKLALSYPYPYPDPGPDSNPEPVGEPAATENGGVFGMSELVGRLKNIRPEFGQVREVDWENALKGAPRSAWASAVADFERDMLQTLRVPDMPAKVLGGYLAVAARGGGDRRGAGGRVESAEELQEQAFAELGRSRR